MKSMGKVAACVAAATMALAPGLGQAEVRYWVTELRPPGAVSSWMQTIGDGGAVNGTFTDAAGNQAGFVYRGGAYTVLPGYLTGQGIGASGETLFGDFATGDYLLFNGSTTVNLTAKGVLPNHVNGAGYVVGGSPDGFPTVYRNGIVSEYTMLPGTGSYVSSNGWIVGNDTAGGTFVASPAGALTTLPFSWFASMDQRHAGVNASGTAVGVFTGPAGETRMGYYDTTLHDLGAEYPGLPGSTFDPRGVNVRGDIFGNIQRNDAPAPFWFQDSFLFTKSAGAMKALGSLGGLQTCSHGFDDAGNVVGHSNLPGQNSDVAGPNFVIVGGKMYDLNTLVPAGTPYLSDYQGQVSNKGQILVNGTDKAGNQVAVLLTPLPVTKATVSGTRRTDGWYTTNATVALAATDAVTGVREIHYSVDGAAEKVAAGTTASVSLTTSGAHVVSFYAVDKAGHAESAKTQYVNVDKGGLLVTTATPVAATVGKAFTLTLGAKGGTAPYTFTTGTLPAGLARSGAVISGTPTAAGPVAVLVTVADKKGATMTSRITFDVAPALVVTTPGTVSANGLVGLTAAGGVAPLAWTTSALPAGIALRGATLVPDGTAALGQYPVTVTVTDDAGRTASKTITVGVYTPVVVTTPADTGAGLTVTTAVNAPFAVPFTASGGAGTYTWKFAPDAPAPAGVSIDAATGVVSGSVAAASTYTVGVVAADAVGNTGVYYFVLAVQ